MFASYIFNFINSLTVIIITADFGNQELGIYQFLSLRFPTWLDF